jgi:hypothetical protein
VYVSWTSFSSCHANVVAQHWRLGLYMAWQQCTAANLKLTHIKLYSSCNTFKWVWKLEADNVAKKVQASPPIYSLPSPLSITHFSTSILITIFSDISACNEKFLRSLVGLPLSKLPFLSVTTFSCVCNSRLICTVP